MNVQIEESWKQHLAPEFEKDYFVRLTDFVRSEYRATTIYPPLSTMTHPSWLALHGMAHRFIELDKAVVHVIRSVSFL